MKEIFRYQIWQWLSAALLIAGLRSAASVDPLLLAGSLGGVNTATWFCMAIAIPIVHQLYVWLIWRVELHTGAFSRHYGMHRAFSRYKLGFSILFAGRLVLVIMVALSNRDSLSIRPAFSYSVAAVVALVSGYLFYSVKRYFTVDRAYGIDHFDPGYDQPRVKQGIFRYTDNGMYVYGLMILYLPGLLAFSRGALLVALFNHIYIWAHYYCTERPDMRQIYGHAPGGD